MASIDRTTHFKRVVSARELAEAFTPTTDEVWWARGRTQRDEHFLALVIRLKSYQESGANRGRRDGSVNLLGVERDEGVAGCGVVLIGVVSASRGKSDDLVPGGEGEREKMGEAGYCSGTGWGVALE